MWTRNQTGGIPLERSRCESRKEQDKTGMPVCMTDEESGHEHDLLEGLFVSDPALAMAPGCHLVMWSGTPLNVDLWDMGPENRTPNVRSMLDQLLQHWSSIRCVFAGICGLPANCEDFLAGCLWRHWSKVCSLSFCKNNSFLIVMLKVQVYSLISNLKTYHPTLYFTLLVTEPVHSCAISTVLQLFRRIELLVHIAISVLKGTHFQNEWNEAFEGEMLCPRTQHRNNVPRLRGEKHEISLKILLNKLTSTVNMVNLIKWF